jgi:hypothetical protein
MLHQLAVTLGDQDVVLDPADIATVGRADDNRLITDDPRVSRSHLQISYTADQWLVENVGRAGTFLGDERVVSFVVTHDVTLSLGSPDGPELRMNLLHDDEEDEVPDREETFLNWELTPFPRNEETAAPMAALTPVPPMDPSPAQDPERSAEPVTTGRAEPDGGRPPQEGSHSETTSRSRVMTARKTSGGATLVVLLLVYLVIAAATHLWPFQTAAQPQASGQDSGHSVSGGSNLQALQKMLPAGTVDCHTLSGSDGPGSLVSATCASTGVSGTLTLTAALFDTQSDEQRGFQSFNKQAGVDVGSYGHSCPPGTGSSGGYLPWHNEGQPSNPHQVLECYQADSGAPVYAWTIPSGHAFVIAVGSKKDSFESVQHWWVHNA